MKILMQAISLVIVLGLVGVVLSYVMRPLNQPEKLITSETISRSSATNDKCSVQIPIKISAIIEQASSSPSVSVKYPQFPSLTKQLNEQIKSAVITRLQEFRNDIALNLKEEKSTSPKNQYVNSNDFSFISDWKKVYINSNYISLIIRFDSYTGGANEIQELQTFNYDMNKDKVLELPDLFASSTNYLTILSSESRRQLQSKFQSMSSDDNVMEILIEGTSPKIENFKYFTFTENNLQVYFPKYSVAPGSFGEQLITIPFNLIEPGLVKSCKATD